MSFKTLIYLLVLLYDKYLYIFSFIVRFHLSTTAALFASRAIICFILFRFKAFLNIRFVNSFPASVVNILGFLLDFFTIEAKAFFTELAFLLNNFSAKPNFDKLSITIKI